MPTFQIVTGVLDKEGRRDLGRQISQAAADAGQPIDAVTVVFIEPQAVSRSAASKTPSGVLLRAPWESCSPET